MGRRVFNFNPGPATLPAEVLEEAQRELLDYEGSGMSLLELSHRGGPYEACHEEARALAGELVGAGADFEVLFLQGGASLQFAMVPLNLLAGGGRGAYVRSGSWARKALADAGRLGDAYVAWDGEPHGFARMPTSGELDLAEGTRYLHVTSNETIEGIRLPDWPEVDVPLVADASSDYFTRPVPLERFDLVYGGVQKNLGPAGLTIVFVRRGVLAEAPEELGAYLRYDTHAEARSLYNTPPTFAVYLTGKMLRWIKARGGLEGMHAAAERRAGLVYEAIEESEGFYRCPAEPGWRSLVNVVFRLPSDEHEHAFLAEAAERGLVGLTGHRSVGGCRASLYNAMPVEGAQTLAEFMTAFKDGRV